MFLFKSIWGKLHRLIIRFKLMRFKTGMNLWWREIQKLLVFFSSITFTFTFTFHQLHTSPTRSYEAITWTTVSCHWDMCSNHLICSWLHPVASSVCVNPASRILPLRDAPFLLLSPPHPPSPTLAAIFSSSTSFCSFLSSLCEHES